MYIFISHSSIDAAVASELCKELESNGIDCFLAPRNIRSGYEYAEEIINGIDKSDAMILILSNKSNTSPHVLREVERAVSKNIPIIVYRIEDVILTKSMEYFLMAHQWVNGKANDYQDMIAAVRNLAYKKERTDYLEEIVKEEKAYKKNQKHVMTWSIAICVFCACIALIISAVKCGGNDVLQKSDEVSNQSTAEGDGDSANVEKIVELGDEITFGEYNGVPIKWRIIKMSEDKKEAIIVTSNIISMKAFDAADSDRYNEHDGESYYSQDSAANTDLELQAFVRGNSDWQNSDIRAWLNGETNIVNYGDSAPTKKKMCEMKNGYDTEPGFLSNFKDNELAAIKITQVETKGNELSGEDVVVTEDKVFLLSLDELELFEQAGLNIFTKPTAECLEQDETNWYQVEQSQYGTEMFYWWLREPVSKYSAKCYVVGTEYWEEKILTDTVGFGGIGIRPAITVDLTSDAIIVEE